MKNSLSIHQLLKLIGTLNSRTIVFSSGEKNTLITSVIHFVCHFRSLVLRVLLRESFSVHKSIILRNACAHTSWGDEVQASLGIRRYSGIFKSLSFLCINV